MTLSVDDLNAIVQTSPFHQLLGVFVESVDEAADRITLRLPFNDNISRGAGTKQHHGGVIASLIDIAGDYAVACRIGDGVPTINFRTDYIRPAFDTDLIAHATLRRLGRTVAICDIEVVSEAGKLIALGRGTYAPKAG